MEGSDIPSRGGARQNWRTGVRLLVTKSGAPVELLDGKTKTSPQADELLSEDILETFGGNNLLKCDR